MTTGKQEIRNTSTQESTQENMKVGDTGTRNTGKQEHMNACKHNNMTTGTQERMTMRN